MISTSFIATSALSSETRLSIARLQAQLIDAQKELSTGRHSDVGVTLGATTGVTVSMRQDRNQIQSIKDSNAIVSTRLQASQAAMQNISDGAQSFLDTLVRAQSVSAAPETIAQAGASGLKSMVDQLNSSIDGQFLFSGINSDVQPLQDYYADTAPTSRQAIINAFQTKFGITPDDPAVVNISADDLSDFLDNEFADQFSTTNWANNWSEASDRVVKNRISRSELADTSVSANQDVFRNLTQAYVMVADLGFENLNDFAKKVLASKAIGLVGNAIGGIGKAQSFLGVTQQRVANSNDQIDVQINFLSSSIENLESVDPSEVATRLSLIQTQMEAAYSLTAQLQNLSLINYLSPT